MNRIDRHRFSDRSERTDRRRHRPAKLLVTASESNEKWSAKTKYPRVARDRPERCIDTPIVDPR
jgi:hypothetical protein